MKYPVNEPDLTGNELQYVTDTIKSGWISSMGTLVKEFEREFSKWVGTKYAVSCNSGSASLEVALRALEVEGKEVIIPTHTMIACPNSVYKNKAKIVLADSDLSDWNMTTDLEHLITKDTKAIMPVHTYGQPCDMDKIMEVAKDYDLRVLEDCAEAHGATYKGKKVGTMGDLGCFSFYANKIITTGEGGMITTNNKNLADKCRYLINHTFDPRKHFWHKDIGYAYRMPALNAAVGVAQLERADKFIAKKRQNAMWYKRGFDEMRNDGVYIRTPNEIEGRENIHWMYSIMAENRDELQNYLTTEGIETRTFFIPIHKQPCYKGMFKDKYPVADMLSKDGLYLPSGVNLSRDDIGTITNRIRSFYKGN